MEGKWVSFFRVLREHDFGYPLLQEKLKQVNNDIPPLVPVTKIEKSFLLNPEEYRNFTMRCTRTVGGRTLKEAQPYASYEKWVTVAPSGVTGGGLGLFALKPFKKGDHIGEYTGECVKCVDGNTSGYIIEAKAWNKHKKKYESWYLDALHLNNAAARYANDACSSYTDEELRLQPELCSTGYTKEELKKIPTMYHTKFRNNMIYKGFISQHEHDVYNKFFIPIHAAHDTEQFEEIFGKYQMSYWTRIEHYSKFHSPNILTGDHYENAMKITERTGKGKK